MNGQLNEHPLGELIREISTAGLAGALRLTYERVKLVVYFDASGIIFAASNLRHHRLPESLRRWGVVTDEQLSQVGERANDFEVGAALVAFHVLSPQALDENWARVAVEAMRPALLWTHGVWTFDPRVRFSGDVRARIAVKELLMETARRMPEEFVVSRFKDRRNEMLLPAADAPVSFELLPAEGFVLSRIDMPLSVYDLVTISTLPEADALRAVYVLALGGYVRREPWPQAFTEEAVAKAREVNAAQAKSAPAAATVAPPPVEEKSLDEKQAPVEEEFDERRELDELFSRLERATNHYHILGVSRSASPDLVKRTYHRLAKRFHPDRFHHDADAALHARIESAFAKIARAYETLKDRQARAVYDMKIEKEEAMRPKGSAAPGVSAQNVKASAQANSAQPPSSSTTQTTPPAASAKSQVEESFEQGMTALRQGNHILAIRLLGEAARLEPKQSRYRAHYGRALASNRDMRRQAEAEFQAAIALDAANIPYRVMLAEFYRDIGFQRRAHGELERALSIDPNNSAARQMLESMRQKG
ncbi:MAG: DnaJ domain-containing protein [Pyrinomonadaceae bacterium]